MKKTSILFFSRGRGRGHAFPDIAIAECLRRERPDLALSFVSYATGAETFRREGLPVLDLGMPEDNGYGRTLILAAEVQRKFKPSVVISHEEFPVITAAAVCGVPSIFTSTWLPQPGSVAAEALEAADSLVLRVHAGIFPLPAQTNAAPIFVGPVTRAMAFSRTDRARLRAKNGLPPGEAFILVAPGGFQNETNTPIADTVISAFSRLRMRQKRLLWLAGRDCDSLRKRFRGDRRIEFVTYHPCIDELFAMCDVVITKGTFGTVAETASLGIPSISLSFLINPIDEVLSSKLSSNVALYAAATDGAVLCGYIAQAIEKSRAGGHPPLDFHLKGAPAAAKAIGSEIDRLCQRPQRSASRGRSGSPAPRGRRVSRQVAPMRLGGVPVSMMRPANP